MIKNNSRRTYKLKMITIAIICFMLLQIVVIAAIRSSKVTKSVPIESSSRKTEIMTPPAH